MLVTKSESLQIHDFSAWKRTAEMLHIKILSFLCPAHHQKPTQKSSQVSPFHPKSSPYLNGLHGMHR